MKLSSSIVLTPSWSSSNPPATVSRTPSSRDRGRDKSPTSSHPSSSSSLPYQTSYPLQFLLFLSKPIFLRPLPLLATMAARSQTHLS
ncbi:hypothetical protein Scep_022307 [Stephania cephalantha]|uniref:Uncharacterized protein n=1 Tax=Stephania cephalantha TaxID=152367 RepID=A0AAP0HXM9_9MAGN